MVIVDEDVDMRPRVAAFVTQPNVHLRMLAGELGEPCTNRVTPPGQPRMSRRQWLGTERPQRLRDHDPDFGNRGFHGILVSRRDQRDRSAMFDASTNPASSETIASIGEVQQVPIAFVRWNLANQSLRRWLIA